MKIQNKSLYYILSFKLYLKLLFLFVITHNNKN